MRRRRIPFVFILAAGLTGCSTVDSPIVEPPPPSPPTYKSLTQRDNVLHNLELAYDQRNTEEFLKLLDQNDYIFFFSPTDVSDGLVQQSSWGYAAEAEATGRLFDRNPPAGEPRADKITLDLIYSNGDSAWKAITPLSYPGETWYQKPVEYLLAVKVGEVDYIQNKTIVAMFTVRQRPGEAIWRIVECRDDVDAAKVLSSPSRGSSVAGIDQATWGMIKELFEWSRPKEKSM